MYRKKEWKSTAWCLAQRELTQICQLLLVSIWFEGDAINCCWWFVSPRCIGFTRLVGSVGPRMLRGGDHSALSHIIGKWKPPSIGESHRWDPLKCAMCLHIYDHVLGTKSTYPTPEHCCIHCMQKAVNFLCMCVHTYLCVHICRYILTYITGICCHISVWWTDYWIIRTVENLHWGKHARLWCYNSRNILYELPSKRANYWGR